MKDEAYFHLGKVILILAGFYVLLRAYLLSITYDEALTYLDYVTRPYINIFFGISASNNHFLNTAMIKFFVGIFGVSEFVVRIPALIGAALYLTASYYISKLLFKKHLFLASVLLLISSPLLMDFLPLARGYSLALGFFMVALYYLLKEEHSGIVISTVMLSVFSVLSFFYVYAAFLLVLVAREMIQLDINSFKKVILPTGISVLLLYLTMFQQAVTMQKIGQFFYGGDNGGFWQDTVKSIIIYNLYDNKYLSIELFQIIIILIIIISVLLLFYGFHDIYFLIISSIIFLLVLFINVHHFLGTKFIIDRTAIFFVPLFSLLVILSWDEAIALSPRNFKVIANIFFMTIIIIFCINFLQSINITHTKQWNYEADLNQIMNYIVSDQKNLSNPISIGSSWGYDTGINFYKIKYNLTGLHPATNDGPEGAHDYYLTRGGEKYIFDKYNISYKFYPVSKNYFGRKEG